MPRPFFVPARKGPPSQRRPPFGEEEPAHLHPLQGQQGRLFGDAAGVPRQAAVPAHHPVTGDDEGDGVVPHRAPTAWADIRSLP